MRESLRAFLFILCCCGPIWLGAIVLYFILVALKGA
jgi:hypothetical protein